MWSGSEMTWQQRLRAQERWHKVLEWMLLALVLGAVMGVATAVYRSFGSESPAMWPLKVFLSLAGALLACYPLIFVLGGACRWMADRTSWVIESGEGVVRVHGSVPVTRWKDVKMKMLAVREGYVAVDAATCERYGCTMAAVPRGKQ